MCTYKCVDEHTTSYSSTWNYVVRMYSYVWGYVFKPRKPSSFFVPATAHFFARPDPASHLERTITIFEKKTHFSTMYIDILLEQIHACGLQVETLVVDVKNNFGVFSERNDGRSSEKRLKRNGHSLGSNCTIRTYTSVWPTVTFPRLVSKNQIGHNDALVFLRLSWESSDNARTRPKLKLV